MIRIAYSPFTLLIEIEEGFVNTVVIENQSVFSEIVSDFSNQLNGLSGKLVLSDDFKTVEIKKKVELVTQIIPFEINKKDLVNKIHSDLKLRAVDETNYQKTQELLASIYKYLFDISDDMDNLVTMDMPEDIGGLLKMFDFKISEDDMSIQEKIIEYMTAVNRYKGEKVFVFVNLRSYLTDSQVQVLFENIVLEKMQAVFIENKEYPRLQNEKVVIIDKDMCVI